MADDPTGEVTELLQSMIRNRCVNDGSDDSGQEHRSAADLHSLLEGCGADIETYEPHPGRTSVVARIEGSDPSAPGLLLMGHTDVVPANPDGWRRDPYGGELVDGEIWGRGAVDMLNLTASMAVATRRLAASGFRPKGSLVYLGVADEEALGTHGAGWLIDNERDAVSADFVITEAGGFPTDLGGGPRRPVIVGEKGTFWCTLRVHGTPGHASQPFRTDNALVKAAEVVRRLAEFEAPTDIHEIWRRFIDGSGMPDELAGPLLDPDAITALCHDLPVGIARQAHACTHTTFAPTIVRGGTKTNVIPDRVDLEVDVRTLPGQTADDIKEMLRTIIGDDLADDVELLAYHDDPSTASPLDTPLWDALQRMTDRLAPGEANVPYLTVGATDARFFRRAGATAYGFGFFSARTSFEDYAEMFHGDDERVDVESLRLSTELWEALAKDVLS